MHAHATPLENQRVEPSLTRLYVSRRGGIG